MMEKIENYDYTAGRLRAAIRNKKITSRSLVLRISHTGKGKVGLDKLLKYLNAEEIPSPSLLFVIADVLGIKAKLLFEQTNDPVELALYLGESKITEKEWQDIIKETTTDDDDTFYLL